MAPKKPAPTTVRLSADDKRLLKALAKRHDLTQSVILKLAIREKAQREGVS